jgi:hypothetical protein
MTKALGLHDGHMTFMRLLGCWRAFGALLCLTLVGAVQAQASGFEKQLKQGFSAAQACEHEVDDDLGAYEECINHATNSFRRQPHVLLGLHFQAWLVADLAARQHAGRSFLVRNQQAQALHQQLKINKLSLKRLCEIKRIDCADVSVRMAQRLP